MLGHRASIWFLRAAFGCACVALPFACARGIDEALDPTLDTGIGGGAGTLVTVGTAGTTGVGGATGGIGGATTSTGSAGTTVGSGGSTGGGGSAAGATGGMGGNATGGGGRGGSGGAGGVGGAGGSGGAGGKAGGGGNGGSMGGGGAGGSMQRPTGVTVAQTTTASGQQLTLTMSGTTFTQKCAANEVIIGYKGTMEQPDAATNWLRSFQAVCATLSVTGTNTYTVNTTQAETLAAHGMPQSMAVSAMCGANQIIVGFGTRTGGAVDQFTFVCAPLVIGGTSPNFTLTVGAQTTLPAMGGPGGSPNPAIFCPAGLVGVGDEGREGAAIEAFGLLCAKPTLVVQ